jgi:hypothetical protein
MTGPLSREVELLATEVSGSIGNRATQLNTAINQLADRAGLLAVGNPSVALDGIAASAHHGRQLPSSGPERLKWIVRNAEARDLCVFSVSDNYVMARRALLGEQ